MDYVTNKICWLGYWKKKPLEALRFNDHSELVATNALVRHFVHWMGCVFSFNVRWGSS